MPSDAPPNKIPTNLITGFLGAGKTTAIRGLLEQRPAGERWSVFVNEYGMVAIDSAMFASQHDEVQIEELGGGCFCCTTSQALEPTLARFLRRSRPDRLLIEPTGAGHPARVIDALRSPPFGETLDMRATICLVDPQDFANPRRANTAVFHDQIQMADVVAVNWLDRREAEQVRRCRDWIERLDPPKLLVAETSHGRLAREWLDLNATVVRAPRFADAHAAVHAVEHTEHAAAPTDADDRLVRLAAPALPGRPLRFENQGQGRSACGWIFSHLDRFDRDPLLDLLGGLREIGRIKGVFRCDDDWWSVNRTGDETSVERSAYRRDSRLEAIVDERPVDWNELESRLKACLLT